MKKYYKLVRKDSSKGIRRWNRHYKRELDSAARASRKRAEINGKRHLDYSSSLDSINGVILNYQSILNDSTQGDSVRSIASENMKVAMVTRLKTDPNFNAIESQYGRLPDTVSWNDLARRIPMADSMKHFFKDPDELLDLSARMTQQKLQEYLDSNQLTDASAKMNEIYGLSSPYKQKFNSLQNKDSLLQAGKDRLAEKAIDYFSQNPGKLESAGQKASKLLSKYSAFSNSSNLDDATKKTSMEGRTLFEKLVFGGSFNVVSTKPFSVDFAPQLGYKFSTKFFAGLGVRYRVTFADSIKNSWYVSPHNTGIRLFTSYDVYKSWYLYGEIEATGALNHRPELSNKQRWYLNYFFGAGRKFLIHPKVYMTLTALYNLNDQSENPVYPRRFQLRVGFQLSELATRKRKINYDPNR